MSPRVFLLLLLLLTIPATAQESQVGVAKKVDRWMWYSREMNEKSMTAGEKDEVVKELRHRLPSLDATDRQVALRLLVRLGDAETIAGVMQHFKQADENSAAFREALSLLASMDSASLISDIAEVLNVEEEARLVTGGELPVRSRSVEAAGLLEMIALRSPDFPPEVQHWAEGIRWKGYAQYRGIFRQWWQQNKEAFDRQDYAAVKPLEPGATRPAVAPATNRPPAPPPRASAQVPTGPLQPGTLPPDAVPSAGREPMSTPGGRATAQRPVSPSATEAPTGVPWKGVIVGVLLLAVAGVGVAMLLRARRG